MGVDFINLIVHTMSFPVFLTCLVFLVVILVGLSLRRPLASESIAKDWQPLFQGLSMGSGDDSVVDKSIPSFVNIG